MLKFAVAMVPVQPHKLVFVKPITLVPTAPSLFATALLATVLLYAPTEMVLAHWPIIVFAILVMQAINARFPFATETLPTLLLFAPSTMVLVLAKIIVFATLTILVSIVKCPFVMERLPTLPMLAATVTELASRPIPANVVLAIVVLNANLLVALVETALIPLFVLLMVLASLLQPVLAKQTMLAINVNSLFATV